MTTNNATRTMILARTLVACGTVDGREVTLLWAWRRVRSLEWMLARKAELLRQAERRTRVRKGMVARACAEMRAAGAWDGE